MHLFVTRSGGDKLGVIVGYYCSTFKAHLHLLKWKVPHLFALVNSGFAVLAGFVFHFECGLCDVNLHSLLLHKRKPELEDLT